MKQLHDLWKKDLKPATLGEKVAYDLLQTTWEAPWEGAGDSNRGCYLTTIPGTGLSIAPPGGWHSMEIAGMRALEAYRVIAKAIDAMVSGQGEDTTS